MKPEWFKLFNGIVPVAGKNDFAVYDLNRHLVHLVQPVVYHQLEQMRSISLTDLYTRCQQTARTQLAGLVTEIEKLEWGFRTTEPERFEDMSLEWHCSSYLQQAVIEYAGNRYLIARVLRQLDALLCKHLELRFIQKNSSEHLKNILDLTRGCSFRSIHLIINHTEYLGDSRSLFALYPKLTRLTIYGAPQSFSLRLSQHAIIISSKKSLKQLNRRKAAYYVVNRNFFCESLRYNPYYNRKVCIDRFGWIKNCLDHKRNFGNVRKTALKTILIDSSFTSLWHASPDRIRDVKDQALRYAMLISARPKRVLGTSEFTLI